VNPLASSGPILGLAVLLAASGVACANGGPDTYFLDVDGGHHASFAGDDAGDGGGDGDTTGNPQPQPQPQPTGGGSSSGSQGSVCADPDTPATCHSCSPSSSKCQANGCYGGYLCDTASGRCRAPNQCP
jgi:hypothetical protein